MTLPEDKKDFVKREVKAVSEKLEVVTRFEDKVQKIVDFVGNLKAFDASLKNMDAWMKEADANLNEIKNASGSMTPEDRVSLTMELEEDVAAKVKVIEENIKIEEELLPQGENVPQDAADFKVELKRILDFVTDLHKRVMKESDNFSEDVKYWAEYKTGIREFKPWLESAEGKSTGGLAKPQTLDEANGMYAKVKEFEDSCLKHLKLLENAAGAANKMTTHVDADEWVKKVDTLVKEWKLLDNTVNELNSWVATDRGAETEQNFSLEKMESTLGELKNIFKEKEKLVDNL